MLGDPRAGEVQRAPARAVPGVSASRALPALLRRAGKPSAHLPGVDGGALGSPAVPPTAFFWSVCLEFYQSEE